MQGLLVGGVAFAALEELEKILEGLLNAVYLVWFYDNHDLDSSVAHELFEVFGEKLRILLAGELDDHLLLPDMDLTAASASLETFTYGSKKATETKETEQNLHLFLREKRECSRISENFKTDRLKPGEKKFNLAAVLVGELYMILLDLHLGV
jgi:hypothetical protein